MLIHSPILKEDRRLKVRLILTACLFMSLAGLAYAQQRYTQHEDPSALLETPSSAQAPRLNCDKPQINPERPMTLGEAEKYRQPDLSWIGNVAVSSLQLDVHDEDPSDSRLTLTFVSQLGNATFCDAKENRAKAILKLAGGKWLGEARVDLAVARSSREVVEFEMDMPLNLVIKDDCTINRDDYVLTLYADFRDTLSELNENNNIASFTDIATASDNICPRETGSNSFEWNKTGGLKKGSGSD